MPKIAWKFMINGTKTNLFEEYGLKFNPFPQHSRHQFSGPDIAIQSLAEAGMNPEEIQKRLAPYFSQPFIDEVLKRYRVDCVVDCHVVCQWEEREEQ